ncbi:MAG TPA: translation initiation factor Sui1 [Burkholderiaceae bacterium]|nr:translation initiation factor Sui1 [Burkholderiaceae bacterium]
MKSKTSTGGGLVYSTEAGRMCPACRQPVAQCTCRRAPPVAAGDGVVRVSRQTRGRGGKTVTVVQGLPLAPAALAELGKRLKTACGSGGTAKDGVIEIQGDHVARVMESLGQQGWVVKRAGG